MVNPLRKWLLMDQHVCPWWVAYSFDNPIRRLFHSPRLFEGLLARGQTAIDIGCGMGFFSLIMARLVGEEGQVIAIDLQEKMLQKVAKRARRAGLQSRIRLHQCKPDTLDIDASADFILASWMVHEIPDRTAFLHEVRNLLKPTGRFLIAEPKLHVTAAAFQETIDLARAAGLELCAEPRIRLSRAALFRLEDKDKH